ncbi:SPL family radical SAM protein [Methanolapillus millepedarum]|uniref:Radical SAM core domain-containing protein n=1 Tax=Methanolapillus millepedarum TaxID=3028296 RepID=A0AA96VCE9_9EURY|nr:hypothetical protein MsAc7_11580 [Methanosarcinaceae archaeon Ac7]
MDPVDAINFVPAKQIITPLPKGTDYMAHTHNMNIYRGCNHGCIYCDSRSVCYQIENFSQVRAKENALFLIEKELSAKSKAGAKGSIRTKKEDGNAQKIIVGTGAMSDPYNSFEKDLCLTRGALDILDRYKCGVSVTTKSALVARDLDLFLKINQHSPVNIAITVTTIDSTVCSKIEPNVSTSKERFSAMKKLSEADLFTGVYMNPVLPFITDSKENISEIVNEAAAAGAKYAMCFFGVTLRKGNRDYFYQNLGGFPNVRQKYETLFGNKYECAAQNAEELSAAFKQACQKQGLLYKMPEISEAIRKNSKGQNKIKQKKLSDF